MVSLGPVAAIFASVPSILRISSDVDVVDEAMDAICLDSMASQSVDGSTGWDIFSSTSCLSEEEEEKKKPETS